MVEPPAQDRGGVADLVVGYSVYCGMTPDEGTLLQNVRAALGCGVQHFSFYNYGIMPPEHLTWVKSATEAIDSRLY